MPLPATTTTGAVQPLLLPCPPSHAVTAAGEALPAASGPGTPGRVQLRTGDGGWLFGFEIPHLPEFLTSGSHPGLSPERRIQNELQRTVDRVAGLWAWTADFSLRFLYDPATGRTRVAVLVRTEGSRELALASAADLRGQLLATDLTPVPLRDAGSINLFLRPFPGDPAVVELRQPRRRQEHRGGGFTETVVPFGPPRGSGLAPFETLVNQAHPVLVSVHLRPDRRRDDVVAYLRNQQARFDTIADQEREPLRPGTPRGQGRLALLYEDVARLERPFRLVLHVASADEAAALRVATAFGTQVGTDVPSSQNLLPRRSRDPGYSEIRATLDSLVLSPWAVPGTEDSYALDLLSDAAGVASLFRFPIAIDHGIPGIPTRPVAPIHHLGARRPAPGPESPEVLLGHTLDGGALVMQLRELRRHGLVSGIPQSGKTTFLLFLLAMFRRRIPPIPWLVIEGARREYRGLLGNPDFRDGANPLKIFTAGRESVAPLHMNPMAFPPGVTVEAHLRRVHACLMACMPQFGALSSVLLTSLEEIYRDRGWLLGDTSSPGTVASRLGFPTLKDLKAKVDTVVRKRGYAGELAQNIPAAIRGRLEPLLLGSLGAMFDCQEGTTDEELFGGPVIIELDGLSQEEKRIITLILLMRLREYRDLHGDNQLQHLTVIEEAHNVFARGSRSGPSEIAADTSGAVSEMLSLLLTEVAGLGESIFLVDQSPSALDPNALRNTNLHVTFLLRDAKDRRAMARGMLMTPRQENYVGVLEPGTGFAFFSGMQHPALITVPNVRDPGSPNWIEGFQTPRDDEVRAHMDRLQAPHGILRREDRPFASDCDACTSRAECPFRLPLRRHWHTVRSWPGSQEIVRGLATFHSSEGVADAEAEEVRRDRGGPAASGAAAAAPSGPRALGLSFRRALGSLGFPAPFHPDLVWCYFLHVFHDTYDQPAGTGWRDPLLRAVEE